MPIKFHLIKGLPYLLVDIFFLEMLVALIVNLRESDLCLFCAISALSQGEKLSRKLILRSSMVGARS